VAGPDELRVGDILGPYRIEAVIGKGGMGVVFRARRVGDGREVALKVLKLELAGDFVFQHRFRQEARAAAAVAHPNLVPIVDAAEADGRHYLAVDFVPGGSLDDLVADGPLPLPQAVCVVADVAAGLDALHEAGIIHRDVKPANVLLVADGRALLTDFGLAKGRAYTVLTRPGQMIGTLNYIAPELIRGEAATARSDVYALGCVAFECVAGAPPFGDKGPFQVGLAHLEEAPPDPRASCPALSDEAAAAILAALAKEPERRPASAGAFARRLAAERAAV
jgi:serine/threonine-protein kinase